MFSELFKTVEKLLVNTATIAIAPVTIAAKIINVPLEVTADLCDSITGEDKYEPKK